MPRAYVVPRATVLPDHPDLVLSSFADLDPRTGVVMTVDPLAGLASGPRQPFTDAEWTSNDPDRPALFVTTEAPGLLVLADSWMPGWTATVDGRPAPVVRGNYAQRVIPLSEPGRHVIAMEYHAPGLLLGCAISLVSTMAWSLIVVLWAVAQRPLGRLATGRSGPASESRRHESVAMRHSICLDPGER